MNNFSFEKKKNRTWKLYACEEKENKELEKEFANQDEESIDEGEKSDRMEIERWNPNPNSNAESERWGIAVKVVQAFWSNKKNTYFTYNKAVQTHHLFDGLPHRYAERGISNVKAPRVMVKQFCATMS